ncbi:MAG TPA: thiamine phosphate synthase, partial [Candidatus Tripitaka sp. YC43]
IIGLSTHSLEQAELAYKQGADYIGIGPIFPTQTKTIEQPIGTEVLRHFRDFPVPCFAIGGINPANLAEVTKAGAGRIAVCSAVIGQEDVLDATRQFVQSLRDSLEEVIANM